jgi:hypothetical protein
VSRADRPASHPFANAEAPLAFWIEPAARQKKADAKKAAFFIITPAAGNIQTNLMHYNYLDRSRLERGEAVQRGQVAA